MRNHIYDCEVADEYLLNGKGPSDLLDLMNFWLERAETIEAQGQPKRIIDMMLDKAVRLESEARWLENHLAACRGHAYGREKLEERRQFRIKHGSCVY